MAVRPFLNEEGGGGLPWQVRGLPLRGGDGLLLMDDSPPIIKEKRDGSSLMPHAPSLTKEIVFLGLKCSGRGEVGGG
jgi:hypothetical protein